MKMIFKYIIFSMCILSCNSNQKDGIAISINKENISSDHFFAYHSKSSFFKLDNIKKKQIIDNFITKKIIIQEAENKDMHNDLNISLEYYYNPLIEEAILEEKVWKPILTEDSMLKTYYNLSRTIALRHIVIQYASSIKSKTKRSKEDALTLIQKIKQKIESGHISFIDAAKKYSEDNSALESGNLGYAKWGHLFEPVQSTAFNLKLREISDPIETRFGYHIIFVYAMKTIQLPSFIEYKHEIEKFIRNSKSPEYNNSIINYEKLLFEKYEIKYDDKSIEEIFSNLLSNTDSDKMTMYMIKKYINYNKIIIVSNQSNLDIDWLKNELEIGSLVSNATINNKSDLRVNIEDIMFRYLARLEKNSLPLETINTINQKAFTSYYEKLKLGLEEKYKLKGKSFMDSIIQEHKININSSLFEI